MRSARGRTLGVRLDVGFAPVAATACFVAAEPAHEPVFGFEAKTESDKDDESRGFETEFAADEDLEGAISTRGPPTPPRSLGAGENPVSRHSPRGPPLA